jgi:hypothetical protein
MIFFVAAKGQSSYAEAMQQGDAAFNKGQYKIAINKYFAAEAFDPTKKDVVKEKVKRAFDAIEALRKKAEDALAEAKKQTYLAIEAKKEAEKEKQNALNSAADANKQKDKADSINKKLQEFLSTVIGAKYKGGKIAWKDSTGKHGLIAADMDIPGWMIYTWDSAMTVCNKYSVTEGDSTYRGWHLPTKDELNKLYVNKDVVGGFSSGSYWSSLEGYNDSAWLQNFLIGDQHLNGKVNKFCVRAVRVF